MKSELSQNKRGQQDENDLFREAKNETNTLGHQPH